MNHTERMIHRVLCLVDNGVESSNYVEKIKKMKKCLNLSVFRPIKT